MSIIARVGAVVISYCVSVVTHRAVARVQKSPTQVDTSPAMRTHQARMALSAAFRCWRNRHAHTDEHYNFVCSLRRDQRDCATTRVERHTPPPDTAVVVERSVDDRTEQTYKHQYLPHRGCSRILKTKPATTPAGKSSAQRAARQFLCSPIAS